MTKKILVFLILLTLCSCKNDENISLYNSGNIKLQKFFDADKQLIKTIEYYDKPGKLEYKLLYPKNGFDSVVVKYLNGKIFKTGNQTSDQKEFGNWKYFDQKGNLKEIREFFIIKGKSIENRNWYLNKSGDTIVWRKESNVYNQREFINDTTVQNSSMTDFKSLTNDTIALNEYYYGYAYLGSPLIREFNSETILVVSYENSIFNSDFSNESKVKTDTFPNELKDKKNLLTISDNYRKQYFNGFRLKFKTSGKKIIRGYLLEFSNNYKDNGKIVRAEKRTYFEKKIFVKDSI